MAVIAVAGLPGSGKSTLLRSYSAQGFHSFDDFNSDEGWTRNSVETRRLSRLGRNVVLSDIEFCREETRRELERALRVEVEWIFFENNPYFCSLNCVYRRVVESDAGNRVSWLIEKVLELSQVYDPRGKILPVVLADERLRKAWTSR